MYIHVPILALPPASAALPGVLYRRGGTGKRGFKFPYTNENFLLCKRSSQTCTSEIVSVRELSGCHSEAAKKEDPPLPQTPCLVMSQFFKKGNPYDLKGHHLDISKKKGVWKIWKETEHKSGWDHVITQLTPKPMITQTEKGLHASKIKMFWFWTGQQKEMRLY